jgi:hypothetical protein
MGYDYYQRQLRHDHTRFSTKVRQTANTQRDPVPPKPLSPHHHGVFCTSYLGTLPPLPGKVIMFPLAQFFDQIAVTGEIMPLRLRRPDRIGLRGAFTIPEYHLQKSRIQ